MSDGDHETFVLYHYTPSIPAAAIFTVVFGASTIYHIWQIVKTKTWYFIPMAIGAAMSAIGYVGRILSHDDRNALGPYIMQSLLLLVAPALFAASIYIILGRLIRLVQAEEYSLVRINWLTKFFVLGDVLSFLAQSAGGGIMATGKNGMEVGEKIVVVGLFIQLAWFGFFIVTISVFHLRMNKAPTRASKIPYGQYSWKTMLYVLYGTSILILVRSVFRVIEYIQGNSGYLLRKEVWLYIFDAVLMSAVVVLYNVYHPSKVLPREKKYSVTSSTDGGYPMASKA